MESNNKTDIFIREILNTGEKAPLHINKRIYTRINVQNNNRLDIPIFIILINIISSIFSGIIFINIGLIFPFFILIYRKANKSTFIYVLYFILFNYLNELEFNAL